MNNKAIEYLRSVGIYDGDIFECHSLSGSKYKYENEKLYATYTHGWTESVYELYAVLNKPVTLVKKVRNDKSKMEKVADALGVELDEPFGIKTSQQAYLYKLMNNGIYYKSPNSDKWCVGFPESLQRLLTGELEIVKLPFVPKRGQEYFTICYNVNIWEVTPIYAENSVQHFMSMQLGNCFRTKVEAEQNKQKIVNLLSKYIMR